MGIDGGTRDLDDIDKLLGDWQQGDVGSPGIFLSVADSSLPITEGSAEFCKDVEADGWVLMDAEANQVVLVTQTCDIVRSVQPNPNTSAGERPWVQVAPLVHLHGDDLTFAARTPRWAPVPSLGDDAYADLDRCTTIEKSVLVQMTRTRGCRTDAELRQFAAACARARGRFAFPNEVEQCLRGLRNRMIEKSGKNSPEGRCVDSVREIRAEANPSWGQWGIEMVLHFIIDEAALPPAEPSFTPDTSAVAQFSELTAEKDVAERLESIGLADGDALFAGWSRLVELWAARVQSNQRVASVATAVHSEGSFPLSMVRRTDQLDFDYLSPGVPR